MKHEIYEYKINADAELFKLMSDKLYTDKVLAVVRELLTNAIDAHIAAGTTDLPIKMIAPVDNDRYFKIRDYGTGLSKEDIIQLYTTYGSSNKRDDKSVTGAMGVGSKSPFAYTDNFAIISYFKGKKYLYKAFLDNNIPKIEFLDKMETQEPNGLEIIVPVKPDDMYNFRQKIEFMNRIANYKINLVNTNEIKKINFARLRKLGYLSIHNQPPYDFPQYGIWMSNILYRIPNSMLEKLGLPGHILNTSLIIYAESKELEVTASREEIADTPKNIEIISQKIKKIKETMNSFYKDTKSIDDLFENIIDKGMNLPERKLLLEFLYSSSRLKFEYQDEKLNITFSCYNQEVNIIFKNDLTIFRKRDGWSEKFSKFNTSTIEYNKSQKNKIIIIDSIDKKYNATLALSHIKTEIFDDNCNFIIDLRKPEYQEAKETLIKFINYYNKGFDDHDCDINNKIEILLSSEIEFPDDILKGQKKSNKKVTRTIDISELTPYKIYDHKIPELGDEKLEIIVSINPNRDLIYGKGRKSIFKFDSDYKLDNFLECLQLILSNIEQKQVILKVYDEYISSAALDFGQYINNIKEKIISEGKIIFKFSSDLYKYMKLPPFAKDIITVANRTRDRYNKEKQAMIFDYCSLNNINVDETFEQFDNDKFSSSMQERYNFASNNYNFKKVIKKLTGITDITPVIEPAGELETDFTVIEKISKKILLFGKNGSDLNFIWTNILRDLNKRKIEEKLGFEIRGYGVDL